MSAVFRVVQASFSLFFSKRDRRSLSSRSCRFAPSALSRLHSRSWACRVAPSRVRVELDAGSSDSGLEDSEPLGVPVGVRAQGRRLNRGGRLRLGRRSTKVREQLRAKIEHRSHSMASRPPPSSARPLVLRHAPRSSPCGCRSEPVPCCASRITRRRRPDREAPSTSDPCRWILAPTTGAPLGRAATPPASNRTTGHAGDSAHGRRAPTNTSDLV